MAREGIHNMTLQFERRHRQQSGHHGQDDKNNLLWRG
jgi:hypothetical protein